MFIINLGNTKNLEMLNFIFSISAILITNVKSCFSTGVIKFCSVAHHALAWPESVTSGFQTQLASASYLRGEARRH